MVFSLKYRFDMTKDLTVGKPFPVLWKFCLPLFLSVIFQQLYNLADSFVAGKFISADALAAVGNSYEITMIFIAISIGCNIGSSVVIALLFGSKEYNRLRTAVYTTFIAGLSICALLMIFGLIFTTPLLDLINTPDAIIDASKLYLDIYIWGLPFMFTYNIASGIFSSLGDSKTTFIFLATSSTANIILDIVFVVSFRMGIAGVAWATFICQGISALLSVAVVIKRMRSLPIEAHEEKKLFSFSLLSHISKIAVPSILQQSFVSVGNIIVQSVINGFGTSVIAGYSAAIKLCTMVTSAYMTLGNGVSNYTAQNLGAGKYDRISEGYKAGLLITLLISIPITIIYFFFPNLLLYIFLEESATGALKTGREILKILSPFFYVVSIKIISDSVLRGTEHMKRFMTTTFLDLLLRVSLAIILAKTALGSTGIWLSWPIGWIIGTLISVIFAVGILKGYKKNNTENLERQALN